MDVCVTRQPVFNRSMGTFAYRLVPGETNEEGGAPPGSAVGQVLSAWFLTIGVERLTGDRPGIVTFNERSLLDGSAENLNPDLTIIEVPPDIPVTHEVIDAARDLRSAGFSIAVARYSDDDGRKRLLEPGDLVTVDWASCDSPESLLDAGGDEFTWLATGVNTARAHEEAMHLAFDYFEGEFYSDPDSISGTEIPIPRFHYMKVLTEINRPDFRFDTLADIVHHDASLSYRLLKYINSAAFGWRSKVRSIQHAMVLLGEREIRRWASLAAMGSVLEDRPLELVTSAVVRGRFCEMLADRIRMAERTMDLFYLGMLSRLDDIVGKPMEELIALIDLADDVREALIDPDSPGPLRALLDAVTAYERADWAVVEDWCRAANVPRVTLLTLYVEAVEWAEALHRPKA